MVSFDKSAPNCECVSPAPRGCQYSHHSTAVKMQVCELGDIQLKSICPLTPAGPILHSAQLFGHSKNMYYFRQGKALDSSPSARVLQIREVYGGKHKSKESTGGTRGGGGEECKLVAANELRTTFIITGKSSSTSGCVPVVSLSPQPVLHL